MFKDYQVFSMNEKITYKLQKTEQSDFFIERPKKQDLQKLKT